MATARRLCTLVAGALVALLVSSFALAGCGGTSRSQGGLSPELPSRAATAGDELLPLLPAGAQVVIELDVERARQSEAIGPLVKTLLEQEQVASAAGSLSGVDKLGAAPLADVRALVIASYAVGTAEAYTLTLVRTAGDATALANQLGAVALDGGLAALGPPDVTMQIAERQRARAAKPADATAAPSFPTRPTAADFALPISFFELRARPMPEAATGAVLRVTAELPFDARLALSRLTNLDPPPARLAVWADVADDAALLVWADSAEPDDPKATNRLAAALRGVVTELANDSRVAALGLSASLRALEVETAGSWARLTVIIGPQRLARAVRRAELWVKSWAKVRAPGPAGAAARDAADDAAISPPDSPPAGPSSTGASPSKEPP